MRTTGTLHDGRAKPLNASGAGKCRALGRWLGRRYGSFANVLWILGGDRVQAAWYNPRTGQTTPIAETPGKSRRTFNPPGEGDWVLVLDSPARDLPTPSRAP